MKRFIMMMATLLIAISSFAQAQITTKKEKLSDISVKTVKVVLTGNEFIDSALREAVKNTWSIAPYEFCSMTEFNSLKDNESYYFLLPVKVQYKKESNPGIMMLSLLKGKAGAKDADGMTEAVSIPMCAADIPSGREAAMLPGLIDIIQGYVMKSLRTRFTGIKTYTKKGLGGKKIIIAESDVAPYITDKDIDKLKKKRVNIVPDEVADSLFLEGLPNTLVSYIVSPAEPESGAVCWKLLIDARTHELYYYKKHSIPVPEKNGFLKGELGKFRSAK